MFNLKQFTTYDSAQNLKGKIKTLGFLKDFLQSTSAKSLSSSHILRRAGGLRSEFLWSLAGCWTLGALRLSVLLAISPRAMDIYAHKSIDQMLQGISHVSSLLFCHALRRFPCGALCIFPKENRSRGK